MMLLALDTAFDSDKNNALSSPPHGLILTRVKPNGAVKLSQRKQQQVIALQAETTRNRTDPAQCRRINQVKIPEQSSN